MKIDSSQLTMPTVSREGMRVLEIIAKDDPDFKELENVILADPALASMVIRYSNSPLYRRSEKITNVPTAVRLLGLKNIRSCVVMATMRSGVTNTENERIMEHFLNISQLCKLIAVKVTPTLSDDLEFFGLIHDMGMLVLSANFPEKYAALVEKSGSEKTTIDVLEIEEFGLSHEGVMSRICIEFRFPDHYSQLLSTFHRDISAHNLSLESDYYQAILLEAHLMEQRLVQGSLSESIDEKEPCGFLSLSGDDLADVEAQFVASQNTL